MTQLIDITQVEVGPQTLTATVRIADDGPLFTSEDLEGTTRVYNLMPHIIEHVCLGDAGETFKDVMGNTELAHLLEHATVEILIQSNRAGDIASGRTRAVGEDGRTFEIELLCPDDVLVAGALSSACWMMEWAYTGGTGAEPDVAATVEGLVALVDGLPEPEGMPAVPQAQVSAPVLQLVEDEAPTEKPSVTADLHESDSNSLHAINTSVGEVETIHEAAPSSSPEALQSAADTPREASSVSTSEPAISPMPAVTSVPPSVTGSLPAPQAVR